MNTEIITEDLGDGYYHHQINVSTYYYYESVVSPINLRESRASKKNTPALGPSLGKFEQYRLSQFISGDDLKEQGQVVKLASVDKGKLVVNPQAIKIFNKYSENEVAFVGNYGRRNSGKSFWYDKILNLSDFDGNNYSSNRREPGLYFWSIPYTKDNLKFFLVDYAGFDGKEQLSPDQEKLLDFELLLCEKLVVVPEPNDEDLSVLRPAYSHMLQSQQRFSDKGIQANKFSPYWPNEIYTLYRSAKPVKKEIDNIGVLFPVYNFSILHDAQEPSKAGTKETLLKSTLAENSDALNEKYVKMSSVVFKDIYQKMKGKEYGNVAFNGKNLPYIIEQSKSTINNGGAVKVDQIFDGVKGNIYDETIQRCKFIYLKEVNPIIKDPEPKPLDVITDAFEKGSTQAFKEFDKEVIDKKVHEVYEYKLQTQIDKLQSEILKENKQKTYDYYNKKLPNNESDNPNQYFTQLKKGFKDEKSNTKLDHNDIQPVEERLQRLFDVQQIHLVAAGDKHRAQHLKKQVALKKKELQSVIMEKKSGLKGGKDSSANLLADKHEILISKVTDLKKEIEQKKQNQTLTPAQKQVLLQRLRDNHSKNQSLLTEIKSKPHQEDEIQQLKDKVRKVAVKNSQIQTALNTGDKTLPDKSLPDKSFADKSLGDKSFADKSHASNRSVRSVIRDIKTQNIKKVTIK